MRLLSLILLAALLSIASLGTAQQGYPSSGDSYIDGMISFELNLLASNFGVTPRFYFLDDRGSPNALASVRGEVYLGLELMRREIQEELGPMGNYSVFAVLAHEFGHIVSFQAGLHEWMSGPQMEIVADFLAGWYMARRASAYPTDAIQGMRSLYRKGDYLFNNPQHHGTPSQRAAAFVAGTNYMQLPISAALGHAASYASTNAQSGPPLSSVAAFGCALVAR